MGMKELLIILLVVLVVFGAKKLRSVGEDLGHAVHGFKKAISDGDQERSANASPSQQIRSQPSESEFPDTKVGPEPEATTKSKQSS